MIYRAIGLMSGSSLDGLDIVFAELTRQGGQWSYQLLASECIPYEAEWEERLRSATSQGARDYSLLHAAYGRFLGEAVNRFIEANGLHFQVALVASHGHTTFHLPEQGLSAQLGDGASIAAVTGLPVVSDLRSLDVALGGQGAPIVPLGERLLFPGQQLFLNIGGIANLSVHGEEVAAFDVCPANSVLNAFAQQAGQPFDAGGALAARGIVNESLLERLNALPFYQAAPPRSLGNEYAHAEVLPLLNSVPNLRTEDALCTYCEHIAQQVAAALRPYHAESVGGGLVITGGGALNHYLVSRIEAALQPQGVPVVVPDEETVIFKEALIMALLGVLRWREEDTTLASVTGARRGSIGGALWLGQEA